MPPRDGEELGNQSTYSDIRCARGRRDSRRSGALISAPVIATLRVCGDGYEARGMKNANSPLLGRRNKLLRRV